MRIPLIKYLNIGAHILIWGTVIYFFFPEPHGRGLFNTAFYEGQEEIPFFLYSTILNIILFYLFSHGILPYSLKQNSFKIFVLSNLLTLGAFVLVECGMDYAYQWYVYKFQRDPSVWEEFGLGYFDWIEGNLVFTSVILALANFYGYTYAWFTGQRDRQILKEEKLKAELSALKHQINPHFLFNILNGLYGLAFKNNDEQTASGIAKLSQLMRYMLYESNDNKVPLSKEIEYLENYIDLQKLRLNGTTKVNFSVDGNIKGKQVAPMLFIPFVENAFKHGISTVNASQLNINLKVLESELDLEVENPIHPKSKHELNPFGGIGLNNVKKRLDLLYRDNYELDIDENPEKHRVHLKLKL